MIYHINRYKVEPGKIKANVHSSTRSIKWSEKQTLFIFTTQLWYTGTRLPNRIPIWNRLFRGHRPISSSDSERRFGHPCEKVIESPRIVANIEAVVPEPALKIKKVGFNSQIQTKFFDVMSSDSGKDFKSGSYAQVGTIFKVFPTTISVAATVLGISWAYPLTTYSSEGILQNWNNIWRLKFYECF